MTLWLEMMLTTIAACLMVQNRLQSRRISSFKGQKGWPVIEAEWDEILRRGRWAVGIASISGCLAVVRLILI